VSPCYYGIDTATKEELIAANYTVPQIQEMLKADSLGYLSIAGVFAALGADENSYCLGCFSGKYPAETPEELATLQLIFNKTK
jgi:amidophosphoribosyltransferase